MEERVKRLLHARVKASGWTLPERTSLLQEILAETDNSPIKTLPIPRRRLKKVGGADEKENSETEDLNVTRCEPQPASSTKRAARVLVDDSFEEKDEPAAVVVASAPAVLPLIRADSPKLSPIVSAQLSPSRDADLHRQQLLDLANDIENLRLSAGMGMDAHDSEMDSNAASEAASTSVQEEALTPVKPPRAVEAKAAQGTVLAQAQPAEVASLAAVETKKLHADEPSEESAVEPEEQHTPTVKPADWSDDGQEEAHEQERKVSAAAEASAVASPPSSIAPTTPGTGAYYESAAAISVDEDADEQAAVARRLLDAAIFNSLLQCRDSPAVAAASSPAIDSPLVVRRAAPKRVVLSDSDERDAPTPAPVIAGSKLRIVQTRSDSEGGISPIKKAAPIETKAKPKVSKTTDDDEEARDDGADEEEGEEEEEEEEGEEDEDDEAEDEEDDEEEEARSLPKNPFVDSEASEASTPDEKPNSKPRPRSRKSDVWLVDDNEQETVLSEEDGDDEEPAGETLHSSDDEEEQEEDEEEEEKETEKEEPKTPAKKTATSQPIFQTPVSKIAPSTASTPLAHTPGTHFQRAKAAMTASLYAEYNKRVFGSKLDPAMMITWTNKLKTTAGRTLLKRRGAVRFAEVELEQKVVDCEEKLRRTLLHELCHAAAWVIEGVSRPPHGETFWKWAQHAKRAYPKHEVRTCHAYVINFKHHWNCTRCSRVIGRHSKSIKPTDRCACGGELAYQVPLNTDGTPRRTPAANPYTQFVKENFAAIKSKNPALSQKELMQKLGEEYKRTPRKGAV